LGTFGGTVGLEGEWPSEYFYLYNLLQFSMILPFQISVTG
jgi:hypothetical protein